MNNLKSDIQNEQNDSAAHHTYGNLFLLDLTIVVSLCIKFDVRIFKRRSLCLGVLNFPNTSLTFLSRTCLLIIQPFLHKIVINSCLFFI